MTPELQDALLSPWFLGLIGLCIGSFLNVVIYRLPVIMQREWLGEYAEQLQNEDELREFGGLDEARSVQVAQAAKVLDESLQQLPPMSLARPASRCPHCGHVLRWHENLPLVGWLLLRGRCSSCRAGISFRYPFVELLTGLLFAGIAWNFNSQPVALLYGGFAAALVALAGIDWDTTFLPESINQPLLWAGLFLSVLGWTPVSPHDAVIGAVVGYLPLWLIYWGYKLLFNKEGMGYGDFKLLAGIGAWLGWQLVLPVALAASLVGTVVGLAMKWRGDLREGRYVPFGPFLAGGALLVLLVGPGRIITWWLHP
ncbi:MAG: prepilin peptidase [Mitsuaria chitosanitabida]|nr:A24 family peptidase [Roseateles chitosanitabidus]MBO9689278.1 prepilin peptidase [Roseateles chitosanitabidus]